MSDDALREAVKAMIAKAFGNSVMVELVDGKFLVHLKVKDPETRPLLEEMAQRCLDCVHDMRMGK